MELWSVYFELLFERTNWVCQGTPGYFEVALVILIRSQEKANDVQAKKEIYAPYNILPLDSAGASQSIMQMQVKASEAALRNTNGLTWLSSFEQQKQKKRELDLLDWLRAMFGFQLDNRAVDALLNKLFKNYKTWCKYLGRKHSLRLPQGQQEVQQRKILYMGLYLLIWGEAANLRFMPECLCYIFHN